LNSSNNIILDEGNSVNNHLIIFFPFFPPLSIFSTPKLTTSFYSYKTNSSLFTLFTLYIKNNLPQPLFKLLSSQTVLSLLQYFVKFPKIESSNLSVLPINYVSEFISWFSSEKFMTSSSSSSFLLASYIPYLSNFVFNEEYGRRTINSEFLLRNENEIKVKRERNGYKYWKFNKWILEKLSSFFFRSKKNNENINISSQNSVRVNRLRKTPSFLERCYFFYILHRYYY
jgi:hypothetical protein